jgi:hypothetical protein
MQVVTAPLVDADVSIGFTYVAKSAKVSCGEASLLRTPIHHEGYL